MSVWQTILVCLYVASLLRGRHGFLLWAVMFGNLAFTMTFAPHYLVVGAVDLLCATVLIGKGRRESLVALVFCAMVGFSLLAKLFSWPIWTTYAIIDALAYIQCFVIGSGHVGNHDNDRASNMRLLSALDRLADWRNAAFASAVSGWDKRR